MSIRRIACAEFSTTHLRDAIIVENFGSLVPGFADLERLLTLASLEKVAKNSSDSVGFVSGETAEEVSLKTALRYLQSGRHGYINGWEYMAGDCGSESIGPLVSFIDSFFEPPNFLLSLPIPSAHLLDSVMKWIFISQGSGSYSGWHKDPIGSAAWMLMVTGEKLWFVENLQGKISSGDLIIIPPGREHRVENVGNGLNVAVSHNWVPTTDTVCMWNELERGLFELKKFSEQNPHVPVETLLSEFQESVSSIDNLLFGLMMVFLHADVIHRNTILEKYCLDLALRDQLHFLLNEIASRIHE